MSKAHSLRKSRTFFAPVLLTLALGMQAQAGAQTTCVDDGKIWYNDQTKIYTYNVSSKQTAYIGSSLTATQYGDIAFAADGNLYGIAHETGKFPNFYKISTTNGSATDLGTVNFSFLTTVSSAEPNALSGLPDGRILTSLNGYGVNAVGSYTSETGTIYQFTPSNLTPTVWAKVSGAPDGSLYLRSGGDSVLVGNALYAIFVSSKGNTYLYKFNLDSSYNPIGSPTVVPATLNGTNVGETGIFGLASYNGKLYTNKGFDSTVYTINPSTGALTSDGGSYSVSGYYVATGSYSGSYVWGLTARPEPFGGTCLATTTDISITKTNQDSDKTVNAGDSFDFKLAVKVNNTVPAQQVVTTDTLPKGLDYISAKVSYDGGVTYTAVTPTTNTVNSDGTTSLAFPAIAKIDSSGIVSNSSGQQIGAGALQYLVTVKANSAALGTATTATVTNTAKVSTTTPETSLTNNTSSDVATIVAPPFAAVCTNMYAMVITSSDAAGYYGGQIQRLDETTNTLTGSTLNLPSGATSATLAVAPDGSNFYTVDDTGKLWSYNTSTGAWSTIATITGVSTNVRMVRMTVAPNGTGYMMNNKGHLWSFTSGGIVTDLGTLTATSTTAPGFYENGDFFATQDGKLYLLSATTPSTTGTATVSLWYVDPNAKTAEYLGDLGTTLTNGVQANGLAATPNGIFAAASNGVLGKVDPVNVTVTGVGSTTTGSTDLASCYYPNYAPKVTAVKSVSKVAAVSSAGSDVRPGDTLEYTITIRNSGNLPAGGALFRDALPAGTTYVANSAKVNGFTTTNTAGTTTNLSGTTFPFSSTKGVGVCSQSTTACTSQILKVDTTPGTVDNEAVITFQVKVNADTTSVANTAVVTYNDGGNPPTDIPTNTTTTPVVPYPQLSIAKTNNATNGSWSIGQSGATYTLSVTNVSTVPTNGTTITVKDILPTGLSAASSFTPAAGWTCTTSGQVVTCTSTNVIAAGATVALTVPVIISASAIGTITNKAAVGGGGDPETIPDPATCIPNASQNPGNQCASNTVTVTGSTVPAACTNLYGLVMAPTAAAYPAYGITIQQIGDTNNVLGSVVTTLPNNQTSATLAVSVDGSKFFVAADASGTSIPLLVYNTAQAQWVTGGNFTLSSSNDRMVRMTVAKDGTGYAMDSSGHLYSFQTNAPYGTQSLGLVTTSSSGAPNFSQNGDMFASDKGLYMLSSVDGTASIDLWLINPSTLKAEYLGRQSNTGSNDAQYNGYASTPNGVFGRDNYGRLVKIDLNTLTLQSVGTATTGSTDLASCYFPTYAPNLGVTKTVKKVAGSSNAAVYPGDTLEYTITVRNTGNLPAGGSTFQDALPAGTTYVPDSARINGATTTVNNGTAVNLAGTAYPFATAVGICSSSTTPCTTQVLNIDTTAATIDNEAVITFRVKVSDPFVQSPSQVSNQAIVNYTGSTGTIPSDDPTTPTPNDPTVIPVVKPAKLIAEKTVRNVTAGTPFDVSGNGKPGEVLEYCIKTSNVGSANATSIRFGDTVPANTIFLQNAYGSAKDIHVLTSTGLDLFYTSLQDADAGALVNNRVSVDGGTLVLQPQQTFTVCFEATIK